MSPGASKLRAAYERRPGAPLYQREFGFYCLDRWKEQGMPQDVPLKLDTDGFCDPVIPIYRELGMDVMSPFEVASGCDVLRTAREYPDLVMTGGVDKRVLAQGKPAIDAMVDRIFPAMQARGGYIPTCDHGVPEEVTYANYLHYRKRCREFAG